MSAQEILEFVIDADCYPNVSIVYRILLMVPVTVASAERKLFEVNYVTGKIEWSGYMLHREQYLGHH